MFRFWAGLCGLVVAMVCGAASAQAAHDDSLRVEYIRNYDGDTLTVNVADGRLKGEPKALDVFLDRLSVRLAGVVTPQVNGACKAERVLGRRAKAWVRERLTAAKKVRLENIERGRYFRVVADVNYDGRDLAHDLVMAGMAVEQEVKLAVRPDWCRMLVARADLR